MENKTAVFSTLLFAILSTILPAENKKPNKCFKDKCKYILGHVGSTPDLDLQVEYIMI